MLFGSMGGPTPPELRISNLQQSSPRGSFLTGSTQELLGTSGAQFTPVTSLFGLDNVSTDLAAQIKDRQSQSALNRSDRQALLRLLGLSEETLGEGGLLGQNFFQSILGGTPASLVGSVGGALAPVLGGGTGGAPSVGQPGFADSPGQPGQPGAPAGGGSLFSQLLAGQGALGSSLLQQLAGFGDSRRGAIQQGAKTALNTALARQEARGLGSGAVAGALPLASEEATQRSLGELEDQLTAQRLGVMQGTGENIFGSVESELGRRAGSQRDILGLLSGLIGGLAP